MVRGLYTAYTGMVNSQHRLDVVSNNLANATTTGYKKEGCTTKVRTTKKDAQRSLLMLFMALRLKMRQWVM